MSDETPLEANLQKTSGTLLSVKHIQKYRGGYTEIRIDGNSLVFRTSSGGCGNVQEELLKLIGYPVNITFSPVYGLFKSDIPRFYKAYDIWSGNKPICTYFELNEFRERDNG